MEKFESRGIKVLGISRDSIESHKKFIAKHKLTKVTLLSDPEKKVIKIYDASHWLFPTASRAYFIVDKNRKIIFKHDDGVSLLKEQTKTLIDTIDKHIK